MHQSAIIAIRAARLERSIGPRAVRVYARKHGAFRLYLLARLLERGHV